MLSCDATGCVRTCVCVHVCVEKTLSVLAKQDFTLQLHKSTLYCMPLWQLGEAMVVYQKTKLLNA